MEKADAIWSQYAKAYDEAEYRRVIEHRAHGADEATRRFNERVASAAKARDEQLKNLGRMLGNPTDDERLADAERSGLLAQRYSEALARGSTGEAAARSARESIVSPDREDVTERRMSETYSAQHAIKIGPSLTATERGLLNELPNELPLGFVSKPLLYSPAIRHAAYTKPQRTALFKLIKRGLLRVERDRRRDMEYLVKVQPNPARSGVRQRATTKNPVPDVFRQWIQQGGKVYWLYDGNGTTVAYVRAHDRGFANGVARKYGLRLGGRITHRDLSRAMVLPELPPANNPKVTVFHANPRRRTGGRPILQSSRVYEIAYKHVKDGKAYKHPFKAGVCMELLPDGSIRIYSRTGKRLWKDFR